MSDWCPIGSLNLHTYNYERTECIWCGPNVLAVKPGRWVKIEGGSAWSADPPVPQEQAPTDEQCTERNASGRCHFGAGHTCGYHLFPDTPDGGPA